MLLLFHFKVKVTEKVDVMIEIMSKYSFGLDYVANVLIGVSNNTNNGETK